MDLYIIRHAWAGHFGDPQWPDDSKRPLTEKGKKRFAVMADILVERGVEPTIIAASPMLRCRQTADILADQLTGRAEVVEQEDLLPEGNIESLLEWTSEQARRHEQIAWVGHCPQVNEYTALLIGLSDGAIRFSKGAAAAIGFEEGLTPGEGELLWLVTAKMLGI
ncbi:MAG: histidine phosphatase family protein [Pirellulales bacterium]|nr:histidine phosphatase family protein [Pirellulales bacterium]